MNLDSPLIVSLITIAISSLIGLLIYSVTARIKEQIRHSIQKAELRFDLKIELLTNNGVTKSEFMAYQESHSKWADEAMKRIEERIQHVEKLQALSAENNHLLTKLVEFAKRGNDRKVFDE